MKMAVFWQKHPDVSRGACYLNYLLLYALMMEAINISETWRNFHQTK
jgi:hypothetical protein